MVKAMGFILLVLSIGSSAFCETNCEKLSRIEKDKQEWAMQVRELQTSYKMTFAQRYLKSKAVGLQGAKLMSDVASVSPTDSDSVLAERLQNTLKFPHHADYLVSLVSKLLPQIEPSLNQTIFQKQLNNGCGDLGIGKAVQPAVRKAIW